MQTLRMTPAMVRSSWWMAGLVGVIGGMLLMLALGLGTGITRFGSETVQTVAVSQPALGAPPGKDLVVPDVNLGSAAPVGAPAASSLNGGRVGGITSADTATDAAIRTQMASGNLDLPDVNERRTSGIAPRQAPQAPLPDFGPSPSQVGPSGGPGGNDMQSPARSQQPLPDLGPSL